MTQSFVAAFFCFYNEPVVLMRYVLFSVRPWRDGYKLTKREKKEASLR